MRTFTTIILVGIFFLSPFSAPKAEAQCLLCGIIGFAIGSSGEDQFKVSGAMGAGGNVIYRAPRIAERLSDPMDVRQISTGYSNPPKGATIAELFSDVLGKYRIENHEQYTILEVMRIIDSSDSSDATFWFAYIESEKIKPLSTVFD